MVAIVRTEWDGTTGGPGLTQFALLGNGEFTGANAQAAVNATRKFWDALKAYLPDELRLNVMPTVDIYNETDGKLTGSTAAAVAPITVAGTGSLGYAGGAGIKINWNTGIIRNGRRVRGATFIVPATATVYTANGTVGGAPAGIVNAACNTLMADLTAGGTALLVWSRPLVKDNVIIRAGATAGIINGTCGLKSAILRGRRD